MLNRLQDVFKSFQQHDVKYVVIGGIASILHGVPHHTEGPSLGILRRQQPDDQLSCLGLRLAAGAGGAPRPKRPSSKRR